MENVTLGQIQTIVIFIATFITSSGVIMGVALKIGKKVLDKSLEPFNKRMEEMDKLRIEQHKETIKLIEEVKVENDMNNVDSIRNRLVAFEQLCRLDVNNDTIKKWQYDNAFKDEDKWHEYHEKYPHINGIIDMAIENIHEHYRHAKF